MVKGNQSIILPAKRPSSSILRTISTNSLNDRKKGTKKISFSKNVFFQEMLNDGSSHVFQELLKESCQLTQDSRLNQGSKCYNKRLGGEDIFTVTKNDTKSDDDRDDEDDEDNGFHQAEENDLGRFNRSQGLRRSYAIIKRRRDSSLNTGGDLSSFNLSSSFKYESSQSAGNQSKISSLSFLEDSHHNDTSIKTNASFLEDSMVYHLNESLYRSDSHIDSFIVNETLSNSRFLDSGRMSRLDVSFLNTTRTMDTLNGAEDTIGHFINQSSRLDESTYSFKDQPDILSLHDSNQKDDSIFNYIEKETDSSLELSESKDEEEMPLHSTFDCRQQSLTFVEGDEIDLTIPSDNISNFIDNNCPSPPNSNFDLTMEDKSSAIGLHQADRKVSLQLFSGGFIVDIIVNIPKYDESSGINRIKDIHVHCCLDKLLEAERIGKILNASSYSILKRNRSKLVEFFKDWILSSISDLKLQISGQKSSPMTLTDLISKISHQFDIAEKLMKELADLYPLHGQKICKLTDKRYQFCFHINGLRRNMFLMIDLDLDVYPFKKANFKFGIHKDDLTMYPIHRFTNYLSSVEPGSSTYIRRLVKAGKTFVKMIGLSRYASKGLNHHFSSSSLITEPMLSDLEGLV